MKRRQILKSAATLVAAITTGLVQRTYAQSQVQPIAGTDHRIEIKHFVYNPATLTVKPGDRLMWVNLDIVPHTATAVDGSWDTGEIAANSVAETVIAEDHGSEYFCEYHPSMKGRLEIKR